jgi:hypothetical protein
MSHYNYTAFFQRYTVAIELNIKTDKRSFVIQRACKLLNKFDKYLQYQAISNWCEKFKLSEKILRAYLTGIEIKNLSNTEKLREFLSTFVITENEITGHIGISRGETKYTYDELTILCEEEDLHVYNLKKLLDSSNKNITVVNIFNPLNGLFKNLADSYRGEPLIHQLADCVKAYDFSDNEPGFYQNRLQYYFHKWLCKAAGQAMHISSNDVMLLWVEPLGGSGKSYLNRWLFSLPEISNYYIRISENESFMDMKGISKAKFAIDWDELPLSRKRYISFKSHIAAEGGQQYNKKNKLYEPYTRQVNFLGSTNKANREKQNGYLLDDDSAMMRRIAPIEIQGRIDYSKYTKDIDLSQLWGQAASEIISAQETNNTNLLTWECDYADLRQQNSRYINLNIKDNREAIKNYFFPSNPAEGRLLTASQMIAEIKKRGIKISMNEWELGNFFAQHNYTPGRNHNSRGWWVK